MTSNELAIIGPGHGSCTICMTLGSPGWFAKAKALYIGGPGRHRLGLGAMGPTYIGAIGGTRWTGPKGHVDILRILLPAGSTAESFRLPGAPGLKEPIGGPLGI